MVQMIDAERRRSVTLCPCSASGELENMAGVYPFSFLASRVMNAGGA